MITFTHEAALYALRGLWCHWLCALWFLVRCMVRFLVSWLLQCLEWCSGFGVILHCFTQIQQCSLSCNSAILVVVITAILITANPILPTMHSLIFRVIVTITVCRHVTESTCRTLCAYRIAASPPRSYQTSHLHRPTHLLNLHPIPYIRVLHACTRYVSFREDHKSQRNPRGSLL